MCKNPNQSLSIVSRVSNSKSKSTPQTYLWFDLVKKPNITIKKFKFNGKLNGDVLEQKEGCCTTFTSKRASIIVEWCKKTMRYKIGKKDWIYTTI